MSNVRTAANVIADDKHSHHLQVGSMPWKKTPFPGIEVKNSAVRSEQRTSPRP